MTGKEMIIYILKNNLENEKLTLDNLFLTESQMAVKLGTGVVTARVMHELGTIDGIKIGDSIYFWRED